MQGRLYIRMNRSKSERNDDQEGSRRAAVEKGIPCFTSLDTARVAGSALALGGQIFNVKPLRDYVSAPA